MKNLMMSAVAVIVLACGAEVLATDICDQEGTVIDCDNTSYTIVKIGYSNTTGETGLLIVCKNTGGTWERIGEQSATYGPTLVRFDGIGSSETITWVTSAVDEGEKCDFLPFDTYSYPSETNAGGGNDTVNGSDNVDEINGGSGDDILNGNGDDDEIYGDDGADELNGGADDDYLDGGTGNDELNGDGGDDELRGDSAGNDDMYGGDGEDCLYGDPIGRYQDTCDGGANDDYCEGCYTETSCDVGSCPW
jgi:Ca2+-binding RTX toxin-like protein